jgi:exosortase/archaeosortase family protein
VIGGADVATGPPIVLPTSRVAAPEPAAARMAPDTLPAARWAALGLLLAGEAIAIGAAFDAVVAPPVAARWGGALMERAGAIVPLATAIAAATWLLGDDAVRTEVRGVWPAIDGPRRWWPFLVVHGLAFGVFVQLSAMVFAPAVHAELHPGLLGVAWTSAGVAVLGSWAACVLPGRALWALARRLRAPLSAGIAVGVAAWAAGEVTTGWWWEPLRRSTFAVVQAMLSLLVHETVSRPAEYVLGTPRFLVDIKASCSGYQGIGLVWVFLGTYLWSFRRSLRFPQALLLLPIGTAVVWLANAARIAVLVLIGSYWSQGIALEGFHSHTGSLVFCGVALGVAAAARR